MVGYILISLIYDYNKNLPNPLNILAMSMLMGSNKYSVTLLRSSAFSRFLPANMDATSVRLGSPEATKKAHT